MYKTEKINKTKIYQELFYLPLLDSNLKNKYKDMTDKTIEGNLVYKNYFTNEVLSIPVYHKNLNTKCFQSSIISNESLNKRNEDYNLIDLDSYFCKNFKNMGYEKLEQAIANQSITYFNTNPEDFDDFTHEDKNGWLVSNFYNLVNIMRNNNHYLFFQNKPHFLDQGEIVVNECFYKIHYNPLTSHIYINEIPFIPVDENGEIILLNENLSISSNFSFKDFKELEDHSYISVNIDDYKDETDKFINNLIRDIRPNEIIKDSLKQNVNTFDSLCNFEALNRYRKDLTEFKTRNGLLNLVSVYYKDLDYKNAINELLTQVNNPININNFSDNSIYQTQVEPLNHMLDRNLKVYDTFKKIFSKNWLNLLNQEDISEVYQYINDAKNTFIDAYYSHNDFKSELLYKHSLVILDKQKYDLELHSNSFNDIKFYEGMKHALLLLNNISKDEYKAREFCIEVIAHFQSYINSEILSETFEPDFFTDKLISANHKIPFDIILNGTEKEHDNLIKAIKLNDNEYLNNLGE